MVDLVVVDSIQNHPVADVILDSQSGQSKSSDSHQRRGRSNGDARTGQARPIQDSALASLDRNVILCDENILMVSARRDANYIAWFRSINCSLNGSRYYDYIRLRLHGTRGTRSRKHG